VPGPPVGSLGRVHDALTLGRRHGTGLHFEVRLLADLARAHLDLDDHSGARIAATEATIPASRQGARVAGALAHSVLARALRESATGADDLAAAAAAVAAGSALAAETPPPPVRSWRRSELDSNRIRRHVTECSNWRPTRTAPSARTATSGGCAPNSAAEVTTPGRASPRPGNCQGDTAPGRIWPDSCCRRWEEPHR
jgi:hypothetical protein